VLNPIGKDDYALARMELFYNELCKFTPVLTTKRVNEYKFRFLVSK
jgi:hypothetical protein